MGAGSYASYMLGHSDHSGQFSVANKGSPGSGHQDPTSPYTGAQPQPLLADVLAGGTLSHEALMDLRVSFNDNLSRQYVSMA